MNILIFITGVVAGILLMLICAYGYAAGKKDEKGEDSAVSLIIIFSTVLALLILVLVFLYGR